MAISTVSVNNTPQANGDTYTKTEDQVSGVYCFDVMSNDLGGNAKILWSLDDSATDSAGTQDLICSDIGETIANTDDRSLNGAKIWIENGKVRYDTSSLNSSFLTSLGALAAGETLTDSFTYAIRMANGTLAWTTASIVYQGENDGVTVTSAPHNGSLTEDAAASIAGSIAFTDPDASDTHTASVTGSPASTLGTFTLGSVSEAAGAQNGTVGWTYEVDNAAAQYLAVGESATESYTITIVDNHGSSTTTTVTVTVTGLNDGIAVTSGAQGGTLGEDAGASLGGTISFTDVDLSDGHSAGFTGPGVLGTFALGGVSEAANAANGSVGWTYAVNNAAAQYLAQGESAVETYVVTVSDGNGATATQNVAVTVTGSNDGVSITTADDSGSLSEDAAASIAGSIAFTDVDLSDGHTADYSGPSGALGTFALGSVSEAANAASGSVGWTYEVDNGAAQYLAAGESVVETYTVTVTDDFGETATQNVEVTILGLNDGVSIGGGLLEGNVLEDSADYQEVGSFAFGDVDLTDTHIVSVAPDGLGYLGNLNALVSNDSTGDGSGQVNWRFQVGNGDLQYLGEGETLVQTYTLTVDDGEGGGATQTVSITLTGDNDGVSITSGAQGGSLSEDAGASLGGSVAFTDVDLSDGHTADFSGPATSLGTFALAPVSEAAGAAGGSVGWTYIVNNAAAQYLAVNESVVETYIVTVTDDFGETATQNVQVTVTGANDVVSITSGAQGGSLSEDAGASVGGSIAFTDVDLSDTHGASISGGPATALGTFAIGGVSEAANAASGSVGWTYTVDNDAAQYLAAGQSVVETYTIVISDGNGSTATQSVQVTVTGANDAATITAAAGGDYATTESGGVGESDLGDPDAAGDVDVSDPDAGQASFQTPLAAALIGLYGTFTFDPATGAWTYTLTNGNALTNELNDGQSQTDTLTVTSLDGTDSHDIVVVVNGTNDAAYITGNITGEVTEAGEDGDGFPESEGELSSQDVDNEDDEFIVVDTPVDSDNGYGTYTVSNLGHWNYVLDNDDPAVQALNDGDSTTDTFTVQSIDGTSQQITITIFGDNDEAFIAGEDVGQVTEATSSVPGDPDASGTLTADDVDNPDDTFTASAGDATYGSYAIDANGFWTYTLDNDNGAVDDLDNSETLTDTFTVASVDGTTHTVSIVINGATDVVALTEPTEFTGIGDTNDNDDLLSGSAAANPVDQSGGNGQDTIHGSNSLITGDHLLGGNGNDSLYGHDGDDLIDGEGGPDMNLYGQRGADTIYGGPTGDRIFGGSGDDFLYGLMPPPGNTDADGGDEIYGGSGHDTIYGQNGSDLIVGGFGADDLTGGGGTDTFRFIDIRDTNDVIHDFLLGTDLLDFAGIDANSATAPTNEAFVWGGTTATANGLWFVQNGTDAVIYGDTDGNTDTAEFMVTLEDVNLTPFGAPGSPPAGWVL